MLICFLIADLYDKWGSRFITNKGNVKSIENIKKSIEITEDWVSKLTDNQKKSFKTSYIEIIIKQ